MAYLVQAGPTVSLPNGLAPSSLKTLACSGVVLVVMTILALGFRLV